MKKLFAVLIFGLFLHGGLGGSAVAQADSDLSGYVYFDVDIDNLFDNGEAGIANVELLLTLSSNPSFSLSAFSNQSGYYEFSGLDAGVYSITQPFMPSSVRNVYVNAGDLRDSATNSLLSSSFGTAVLLDQQQGILPHVEGIELLDLAYGTDYNFGQLCFGKAWLTTAPPPVIPVGQPVPEPTTGLLLVLSGLLVGSSRRRRILS